MDEPTEDKQPKARDKGSPSARKRYPNRIREERIGKTWSQQELADQLDVTLDAVRKWENGKVFPSDRNRSQLLSLFGKTRDDELWGEQYAQPSLPEPEIIVP